MLHFLLGLALCIFIGERLWHYVLSDRYLRGQVGKMVLGFGGAAVGIAFMVLVLIASSGGRH